MRRVRSLTKMALIAILLMVFSGQALAWGIEKQPLFSAGNIAAPGGGPVEPTFPRCLDNCNAGEVQVLDVWLDAPSCEPPSTAAATLNVRLNFNSQRYCALVVADVYIDGQLSEANKFWGLGTSVAGPHDYVLGNINWPCGSVLELRNILIQWDVNNGTCAYDSCDRYQAQSKCDQRTDLIVRAPLVADFSATTECQGAATQFTDETTGGLKPYGYSWSFGDGSPTSALQNPMHTYAAAGTYTVTLTVTDSSVPAVTDSQTHIVSVVECCTLKSATVIPDLDYDPEVCGSVGTLTANVVGGEGPFTYQWFDGVTPIGTSNPLENVILEPGDHSIYVVVTDTAREDCAVTSAVVPLTAADVYPPDVSCPDDIIKNADPGKCTALVAFVVPVDDNCELASIAFYANGVEIDDSHNFPVGETTVQVVATDVYGNVNDDCTFKVTVTDAEKPAITCPAPVSVNADAGKCYATGVDLGKPTTGDNCGVASVTNDAPAQFPVGQTTVTWTVTDIHGNRQTCTQLVTVTDTQAPSVTCPADIAVNNDPGQCGAEVKFQASADDNCDIASLKYYMGDTEITSPHLFPVGVTTVKVVAEDVHGATSNCTFTVTVNDSEAPTITCPADIAQDTDKGLCSATVTLGDAKVSDNCGVAEIASWRSDGLALNAAYPLGVTTITREVTDVHGNKATCTQKVTIEDKSPTVIRIEKNGPTVAAAGDTVVYTFKVTNDSVNGDGAPIANVSVVDDVAGPATYVSGNDNDNVLEMGETWIFRAQYMVQEDDPNLLVNTATATGQDCDGDKVTDRDSHTLKLARAELGQPNDWHDPHCAGWRQRYTVVFTNTGAAELTDVILGAVIPAEATFDVPSSSADLVVDDATHAHWLIGVVQPGEVVKMYLEIRASTTMAGKMLTTCFTLDADQIAPITKCEDSAVVRCEGPSPTPQPTLTPKPTKTATPKPTNTPLPSPTPTLPKDGRVIWLPIINAGFTH